MTDCNANRMLELLSKYDGKPYKWGGYRLPPGIHREGNVVYRGTRWVTGHSSPLDVSCLAGVGGARIDRK